MEGPTDTTIDVSSKAEIVSSEHEQPIVAPPPPSSPSREVKVPYVAPHKVNDSKKKTNKNQKQDKINKQKRGKQDKTNKNKNNKNINKHGKRENPEKGGRLAASPAVPDQGSDIVRPSRKVGPGVDLRTYQSVLGNKFTIKLTPGFTTPTRETALMLVLREVLQSTPSGEKRGCLYDYWGANRYAILLEGTCVTYRSVYPSHLQPAYAQDNPDMWKSRIPVDLSKPLPLDDGLEPAAMLMDVYDVSSTDMLLILERHPKFYVVVRNYSGLAGSDETMVWVRRTDGFIDTYQVTTPGGSHVAVPMFSRQQPMDWVWDGGHPNLPLRSYCLGVAGVYGVFQITRGVRQDTLVPKNVIWYEHESAHLFGMRLDQRLVKYLPESILGYQLVERVRLPVHLPTANACRQAFSTGTGYNFTQICAKVQTKLAQQPDMQMFIECMSSFAVIPHAGFSVADLVMGTVLHAIWGVRHSEIQALHGAVMGSGYLSHLIQPLRNAKAEPVARSVIWWGALLVPAYFILLRANIKQRAKAMLSEVRNKAKTRIEQAILTRPRALLAAAVGSIRASVNSLRSLSIPAGAWIFPDRPVLSAFLEEILIRAVEVRTGSREDAATARFMMGVLELIMKGQAGPHLYLAGLECYLGLNTPYRWNVIMSDLHLLWNAWTASSPNGFLICAILAHMVAIFTLNSDFWPDNPVPPPALHPVIQTYYAQDPVDVASPLILDHPFYQAVNSLARPELLVRDRPDIEVKLLGPNNMSPALAGKPWEGRCDIDPTDGFYPIAYLFSPMYKPARNMQNSFVVLVRLCKSTTPADVATMEYLKGIMVGLVDGYLESIINKESFMSKLSTRARARFVSGLQGQENETHGLAVNKIQVKSDELVPLKPSKTSAAGALIADQPTIYPRAIHNVSPIFSAPTQQQLRSAASLLGVIFDGSHVFSVTLPVKEEENPIFVVRRFTITFGYGWNTTSGVEWAQTRHRGVWHLLHTGDDFLAMTPEGKVWEGDHSGFDQKQRESALSIAWAVYEKIGVDNAVIKQLRDLAFAKFSYQQEGVGYSVQALEGMRNTGGADTTCSNSLIAISASIGHFLFDLDWKDMGFEVKEELRPSLSGATFLRRIFIENRNGSWSWVQLLSAAAKLGKLMTLPDCPNPMAAAARSLAYNYEFTPYDFPLLGAHRLALEHMAAMQGVTEADKFEWERHKIRDVVEDPEYDREAILDVFIARYGISEEQIIDIEQWLRKLKIGQTLVHPVFMHIVNVDYGLDW